MSTTIPEVVRLLGKNVQDAIKGDFVAALQEAPVLSHDEDRTYVDLPVSGISLVAIADGTISSVQLYAKGYQNHSEFKGVIPFGLSFKDTQEGVRKSLGQPTLSGGGRVLPVVGKAPSWDRFDEAPISLHLQYAKDGNSIELITIMLLEIAQPSL